MKFKWNLNSCIYPVYITYYIYYILYYYITVYITVDLSLYTLSQSDVCVYCIDR